MKTCAWEKHSQRGYTLTEIAVVMAIFGIVITGVFAAGQAQYAKMSQNKAGEELNIIQNNVRAYYSSQNATSITVTADVTQNMINANVFPGEMVSGTVSASNPYGTVVQNPWGGTVSTKFSPASGFPTPLSGTSPFVQIEFDGIPVSNCVPLLLQNSIPGRSTHLIGISLANDIDTTQQPYLATATPVQLPFTPSAASTACNGGNTYSIIWYYLLTDACVSGVTC